MAKSRKKILRDRRTSVDNRPVNIFKPDPLKQWRSRHTRESKTITVMETDWPGILEVCRNAVDYIEVIWQDRS